MTNIIPKGSKRERQTAIETALAFDKGVSRVWVDEGADYAIIHKKSEMGYYTLFGLSAVGLKAMAALGWTYLDSTVMWTEEATDLEMCQHFGRAT
jgi:hypothetical protein